MVVSNSSEGRERACPIIERACPITPIHVCMYMRYTICIEPHALIEGKSLVMKLGKPALHTASFSATMLDFVRSRTSIMVDVSLL